MNRSKFFFAALISLLFLPLCAFANSAGISPIHAPGAPADLFNYPLTDWSVRFLGQIFGSIGAGPFGGELLHGTSGQLLGKMMKFFNWGMIAVAGSILVYTVITSVINTATDGEFMGRNFKSFWIISRTIAGFGLLVPNTITGYSTIQWLVMWIVLQGVGLADHTMDTALKYLQKGGNVYSAGQTIPQDEVTSIGNILQAQVCMYKANRLWHKQHSNSSNNILNQNNSQLSNSANASLTSVVAQSKNVNSGILPINPTKPVPPVNPIFNYKDMTVTFPGVKDGNYSSAGNCGVFSWKGGFHPQHPSDNVKQHVCVKWAYRNNSYSQYNQPTRYCAKYEWQTASSNLYQGFQKIEQYKLVALRQVILDLAPMAKEMAQQSSKNITDEEKKLQQHQAMVDIVGAAADYINLTEPARTIAGNANKELSKQQLQKIKARGWAALGAYEGTLIQLHNTLSSIDNFLPKAITKAPNSKSEASQRGIPSGVMPDIKQAGTYVGQAVAIAEKLNKQNQGLSVNLDIKTNKYDKFVLKAMTLGMTNVAGDWISIMKSKQDPMIKLHELGLKLIQVVGAAWLTGLGLMLGTSTLASTGSSASGLAYAVQNVIGWILPFVVALSIGLFAVGAMLAIYLPMIPFIIFSFAVFSWLFYVVLAFIGAVLIALGMTHPEGHDWLGKAEQSMMILLSVFIRPILLTIGFFVAIMGFNIIMEIINLGYKQVVVSFGLTTVSGGAGMTQLLVLFALLAVYATILVTAKTKVYDMFLVKLPEEVVKLIGITDATHSDATSVAEATKGVVYQGGQSMGQAATQSIGAMKGQPGADSGGGSGGSSVGTGDSSSGGAESTLETGAAVVA